MQPGHIRFNCEPIIPTYHYPLQASLDFTIENTSKSVKARKEQGKKWWIFIFMVQNLK